MATVSSRISDALLAQARASLRACRLCPRACDVDRTAGKSGAFCRLGADASVYRELLSVGEEPEISPTWLIDLGGCSLRCLFCSEWRHVTHPQAAPARPLTADWFVPQLRKRKQQGARTISFAGGDPTVSLVAVLEALAQVPDGDWLPVVWNCNGWLSDEALRLLAPVVSIWLVDVKFGNPDCAQRLAGVSGTVNDREVARTLAFVRERGLMLRHLAMPGHLDCCTQPVLRWLRDNYPELHVNVMMHYVPFGPARSGRLPRAPELTRLLSPAESVSLGGIHPGPNERVRRK